MGRFSRSNFYDSILFAPAMCIAPIYPLVLYLGKNSHSFAPTLERGISEFNNVYERSMVLTF